MSVLQDLQQRRRESRDAADSILTRASDEGRDLEPDELDSWGWYTWDRLPAPLFLPMASLVATGYDPFDG